VAISMTYSFGIYVACSEIEGLFERPIYRELEIHIEGYAVHQEFGQLDELLHTQNVHKWLFFLTHKRTGRSLMILWAEPQN
jgi:hypothetical protein